MRKTFIETADFTDWVKEYLSDDELAALQRELLIDPDKGVVITGCGGLRKLRAPDPKRGKGKRGGARVIYLHVAEAHVVFLMDIYGKGEKVDLTTQEKRILKSLADQLRHDAILSRQRSKRGLL